MPTTTRGVDMADLDGTYAPSAGGLMLVGTVDGTPVAMGGIRRIDDTTCELLRMRVDPEHQARGHGTAILQQLEAAAHQLGYRRITLITGENQHPAVDLYRRRGYRTDRRETLIGIPSVHMSKDLGAS